MFHGPSPSQPDAYLARDVSVEAIEALLEKGFRWVRSDGEWAIFERDLEENDDGSGTRE